MKRFSTLLSRGKGSSKNETSASETFSNIENAAPDSPEGNAARAVRLFCESGSASNRDEEVLHLPTIVDAAESSPSAAAACAAQIRAFLQKQYMSKPHVQYNAIMLIRILCDNPGPSFTRNFDDKFVKSLKHMLRENRDHSVQQLLRETLDTLEANKAHDAGLQGAIQMWRREKGHGARLPGPGNGPMVPAAGAMLGAPQQPLLYQHNSQSSHRSARGQLPSPTELASRVEESRNTAKILIQFLQTTPAEEVMSNELIKEFADRCQSASRSMQTFINCENPPPDDDTLQTLIETNEQLSLANSRYQRAILAARRAMGVSPSPNPESRSASTSMPSEDRPAPQLPPPTGFGTYQSHTTYNAPPQQPVYGSQPASRQPSIPVVSQQPSRPTEDYDDLYDSPVAARAPAANPFSDPTDQRAPARAADTYNTQNSNAYTSATSVSGSISPQSNQSPVAMRPAPGAWHNSTISPSFLGRQASAADGLTMHAPGTPAASEIDGYSGVGRTDYRNTAGRSEPQTSFTVTQ